MKIISLVPSWTETLIELGFQVSGRTRYCLYPDQKTEDIQVVGGTKDINWTLLNGLGADLLVVDKEENRQEVEAKSEVPLFATHVRSLSDVYRELERLKEHCGPRGIPVKTTENLESLISRWKTVSERPLNLCPLDLKGLIQWIHTPQFTPKRLVYVIWEKPWMAISRETFIGNMLSHIYEVRVPSFETSYPQLKIKEFNDGETLFLFSSEPYPFGDEENYLRLQKLQLPSALVDGECYSWFGIRSLKFLESLSSH